MVVSQVINSRARLTELERRIKETEELEERLEVLEQARVQKGGGRRCGGLEEEDRGAGEGYTGLMEGRGRRER